jgi:hypothetical protein
MKKILAALMLVCLIGCKGEKGDQGQAGLPGTANTRIVSGVVSGDTFTVTDSALCSAGSVSVYIGVVGAFTEMPYFLPSQGINTFYIWRSGACAVDIYNAKLRRRRATSSRPLTKSPPARRI